MTNKELVIQRFKDTIEVKEDIMADNTVITTIVTLADEIAATISRGNFKWNDRHGLLLY